MATFSYTPCVAYLMAVVYLSVAFGFTMRTLVNRSIVPEEHFVYFTHYLRPNSTADKALFEEHPSLVCIVSSLVYTVLCLVKATHAIHIQVAHLLADGVIVALLLSIVVGIVDVLQMFTLVGMYTAFQVLVYWFSLLGVAELPHVLMLRGVTVELLFVFWASIILMVVLNWERASVSKLLACGVAILDLMLLDDALKIKVEGMQTTHRRRMTELTVRHVTRFTLLVCVFVETI